MAQVLHSKTYMSISTIIQLSYMQSGTWALPGGHLDFGESFETCAMREVLEETDLQVKDDSVRFLTATNDVMPSEHKHYVTIFMACRPESEDLEPKVGIVSCARAGGRMQFLTGGS
jgi:ADP-ribose pyrophosphatase YjhB (NUDIX family)